MILPRWAGKSGEGGGRVQPIIPIIRKEAFDDPAYLFELKLDGFRGLANTIQGRMLSKNSNRLRRFERLLDALPPGYVFDGEIVALDRDGRPRFNDLLFDVLPGGPPPG